MLAAVDILTTMLTRNAVTDPSAASTHLAEIMGSLQAVEQISGEAATQTVNVVKMMINAGAVADLTEVVPQIIKLGSAFTGEDISSSRATPIEAPKPKAAAAAPKPAAKAPAAPAAPAAAVQAKPAAAAPAKAPATHASATPAKAAAATSAPAPKAAPAKAAAKPQEAPAATRKHSEPVAKSAPAKSHAVSQEAPASLNGGAQAGVTRQQPAVPIIDCFNADYLICLEDGKKMKMLKRHLRTEYNLSPEEYRAKWGLPPDFPMVAPNYAKQKSRYARSIGLGSPKMREEVALKRQAVEA